MEERRRAYDVFMSFNASKARPTSEPTAHVMFKGMHDITSSTCPLVCMSVEDVLTDLDKESPLVQQLLRQLHTYDCHTERVVGLVFDRQTVLSDVLRQSV